MNDHSWSEPEEPERPIEIVRSEPVRIRFDIRPVPDEEETVRLVTWLRDRRIATRAVARLRGETMRDWNRSGGPVALVGIGTYETTRDLFVLYLGAELTQTVGWHESGMVEVFLGTRFRAPEDQLFPGDLARETRDLFGSLLQGSPSAAIARVLEDAREQSVAMHPIWERCRQQAVEDGLPPTAYKPGSDIAEGLWTRRWKKADLDREDR